MQTIPMAVTTTPASARGSERSPARGLPAGTTGSRRRPPATRLIALLLWILPCASLAATDILLSETAFTGDGTYYTGAAEGSCSLAEWSEPWHGTADDTRLAWPVAINSPQYLGSETCGLCMATAGDGTGTGADPIPTETIRYVYVQDVCPGCLSADLDYREALQLDGRFGIAWYAVECPTVGPFSYRTEGSNPFFLKIQVRNHRIPVRSVEIRTATSGEFVEMPRTADNHFQLSFPSGGATQFDLRITSVLGDVVVEPGVVLTEDGGSIPDQTVVGTVQFPASSAIRNAFSSANPLPTAPGANGLEDEVIHLDGFEGPPEAR